MWAIFNLPCFQKKERTRKVQRSATLGNSTRKECLVLPLFLSPWPKGLLIAGKLAHTKTHPSWPTRVVGIGRILPQPKRGFRSRSYSRGTEDDLFPASFTFQNIQWQHLDSLNLHLFKSWPQQKWMSATPWKSPRFWPAVRATWICKLER